MRPFFTIVTPVYNRERFIAETLYSVLNQDFTDWSMVIVDDGSRDRTVGVVEDILAKSKQADKVQVFRFKHNQGCAAATIEAIKRVDGVYFTVVDSDDILYPDALSNIAAQLVKRRDVKFLWTKFVQGTSPSNYLQNGYSKKLPNKQSLRKALSGGWWGAQHQKVCHTDTYRQSKHPIQGKYKYAVDFQLAVAMAETECPVYFYDKVTYFLRLHQWRMSSTVGTLQRNMYDKLRIAMLKRYDASKRKAKAL